MPIPSTITKYCNAKHVHFSVVTHPPSQSSLESAHGAHVSGEKVAKGVLLNGQKGYLLAVLPASHELRMDRVEHYMNMPVSLAPESKLTEVFSDCAPGAVPVLGTAYGLRSIVDLTLAYATDVYFEAGDHEELLHVSGEDFRKLIRDNAQFAEISKHRA